jgi:hypothetical protein
MDLAMVDKPHLCGMAKQRSGVPLSKVMLAQKYRLCQVTIGVKLEVTEGEGDS